MDNGKYFEKIRNCEPSELTDLSLYLHLVFNMVLKQIVQHVLRHSTDLVGKSERNWP